MVVISQDSVYCQVCCRYKPETEYDIEKYMCDDCFTESDDWRLSRSFTLTEDWQDLPNEEE